MSEKTEKTDDSSEKPSTTQETLRHYDPVNLYPTIIDPQCSEKFPLSKFWPMYVGNFWCDDYSEHDTLVQEYFASKGLLVRMVFGRQPRYDLYHNTQQQIQLYDFLVYFVSKKDTKRALSWHRDTYCGHRLNIFPGRTPSIFTVGLSVKYRFVQECPENRLISATDLENDIRITTGAEIACVIKDIPTEAIVEYVSKKECVKALEIYEPMFPERVDDRQRKQRFLEIDVLWEIEERIRTDINFMQMCPSNNILHALFEDRIPELPKRNHPEVVHKKIVLSGDIDTKEYLQWKVSEYARQIFKVTCNFAPCREVRNYLAHRERQKADRLRYMADKQKAEKSARKKARLR